MKPIRTPHRKHPNMTTEQTSRPRSWLRALAAVSAALLAASILTLAPTPPKAEAAGMGAGIWVAGGTYWLGSYITSSDGAQTYCIEPGMNPPTYFDQSSGSVVTSMSARYKAYYGSGVVIGEGSTTLNSTTLGRMNWLIRTYGMTSNNNQAAAVAWALKRFVNPHHNTEVSTGRWPSVPAGVRSTGDSYYTQALSYNPSSVTSGSGTFTFDVDHLNHYAGHLNITALSPSPTTGTITLTNGIFVSNGLDTISGTFAQGDSLEIYGVPPEGQPDYKISALGEFVAPAGPAGALTVYTTVGGRQSVGGPGPVGDGSFEVFAEDPFDRATVFAPVLTTQVSNKFVAAGDTFTDEITFATADVELEGENPGDPPVTIHNPWYQLTNDNYIPITAAGTLYGPFTDEPIEADEPPLGAPIAGTATVTTTQANGPTVSYPVTTTGTATATGYYTWVWEIDYAQQHPGSQMFLVDDYRFVDRFGQAAETHVMASEIVAVSQVSDAEVPLSGTVTDTLTVSVAPGSTWLSDNTGAPIPVTFRGEAWLWPGTTAPAVSPTVPSGATLLDTVTITANAPGEYTSAPLTVPAAGEGWVSWVWSIRESDQPVGHRGVIREWSDGFGLPNETTRLLTPTVSTLAVPEVVLGEPAHDVATIGGTLPALAASLSFAAYLQPDSGPATCVTPAYDSSGTPIAVTELGDYASDEFTFTAAGTYFWVETLRAHDGQIIHQGDCGAPLETTVVLQTVVTTAAVREVTLGGAAHDTAFVRGVPLPGSYLEFAAYLQPDSGPATCTPDTLVFTSAPVMLNGAGEYSSAPTVFTQTGTYFWVETMFDSDDNVLHEGECGAELEITTVLPLLGSTGYDSHSGWLIAGVAGVLMLLGGGLIIARRRVAQK